MLSGGASKRFEMIRCLGEGGMGVVYEALDRDVGARVALKTLRHASPESLARLKHEFRAMQDVQHPNLVGLRELVVEDGQWFIVMELIEGVDFISWVRGSSEPLRASESIRAVGSAPTIPIMRSLPSESRLFDEARLRSALRQVAEGLQACHSAGFVHRDVKPSNLLVTREGRVVILDFGLVAETHVDSTMRAMAGTPAYMAPEQAASGDVGPEADWYSLGVLVYEALTGRVPIEGAPLQVMMRKQNERPVPPSAIAAGVPEDLDALSISLLRFAPLERPGGAVLLRLLGAAAPQSTPADDRSRSRTLSPPFVGRERELAELSEAFASSRTQAVSVCVEGESGVGKSRLVRRLTERIGLEDPSALVLVGRCYERESLPYKAFDGIVDAIARFLAKMPDAEARALLPTRPLPLVQVFPILQRIPAIAALARDPHLALDPHELRSRAFSALRELLTRIAEQRPLVLVIDDAQWSDEDSFALLAEVLREPEAPRLLLVATVRSAHQVMEASAAPDAGSTVRLTRVLGPGARTIGLSPLSPEASRELAALLLPTSGDPAVASAIAAEAGGHPLFIDILARQGIGTDGVSPRSSSLEDSLRTQLATLDAGSRAIVETVSLADSPLRQRDVLAAAWETGEDAGQRFARAMQHLRVARLIVSSGGRGDDRVEPYHDRVRSAVLAGMSVERREQRHRRIALALEISGDAKPQALALHWGGSGDPGRSAHYSALAGDRAAQALAFDRAASFYEQALQAAEHMAPDERRTLKAKLGDALASGGRGKRAADALHDAAQGAPAAEALDLRRRAAEQLLRCGHFDEGLPALENVLASVGVRLPRSPFTALLYLLVLRAWLFVRGTGYKTRDSTQVSAEALVRVDTCWSAALGLGLSDTVRATALQASNLLAALRLGEPYRVARALGLEIAFLSSGGSRTWSRTEEVVARARREAELCGHAYARAMVPLGEGVARYLSGRYVSALARIDSALEIFRDYGRDVSWEIGTGEMFATHLLAHLGRLRDLRERVSRSLPEMLRRGDLHGSINLRVGWANFAWLVGDEVDTAQRHIDEAMSESSQRGFHLTHFWELVARTNLSLYVNAPPDAYRFVTERWGAMQKSLLPHRIQSLRVYARDLRARASVALAMRDTARRATLLRAAERDARHMAAEGVAYGEARAAALRAGMASVRGDVPGAVVLLRTAIAGFEASDMALHASVCRAVLADMLGGEEGERLRTGSKRWFREQGVKRPHRFVRMLTPGFARVAGDGGTTARRSRPQP